MRASDVPTLPPGALVYVKFGRDTEARRLVPLEVFIESTDGSRIRGEHLRKLPLDVIEAVANEDDGADVESGMRHPGPLLGIAASHMSTPWGEWQGREFNRPNWATDMLGSQINDSGVPRAKRGLAVPKREMGEAPPQLTTPPDGRYSDEWFRSLARSYNWALLEWRTRGGEPPAKELARQAGVSVKTVHSWVYRARKAGFLSRVGQGQAG